MHHRALCGAAVLLFLGTACGSTTTVIRTPVPTHGQNERTVDLRDASGAIAGRVTLASVPASTPSPGAAASPPAASPAALGAAGATAVSFHVVISSLPPGSHGFHIHQRGACDPPDFATAGPHFNPTNSRHGHSNPAGPHAGDLGNLSVGGDGRATIDLLDNLVTLEQGAANSLVGTGSGSSLIVDSGVDDETTDPEGKSGSRIACGIISVATEPLPTPSPSESPSPSSTPSPTATPRPRRTPTPTPIPVHTPTPSPTHTPTPSPAVLPLCINILPPHTPQPGINCRNP